MAKGERPREHWWSVEKTRTAEELNQKWLVGHVFCKRVTSGENKLDQCENEMLSPWNTEKTEINLLNTVRIFLSEQLFKGWHCFTDSETFCNFFSKHLMKHRSGISVRASTQPGVTAQSVCPRLPQPLSQSCLKAGHLGLLRYTIPTYSGHVLTPGLGTPKAYQLQTPTGESSWEAPGNLQDFHFPFVDWVGLYILVPIPHPPCAAGMENVHKSGFEPGKKGGVGEGVFYYYYYY